MAHCKTCFHYNLYEMITSGKTYSYSGEIPCFKCSKFMELEDKYIPANDEVIKQMIEDDLKKTNN